MLRGINRYIIEINDTENIYFDKVILFVKPQYSDEELIKLEKEGRRIIDTEFFSSSKRFITNKKSKLPLFFLGFISITLIFAGIVTVIKIF